MSGQSVVPVWSASARLLPESRLARLAAAGDARAFEAIFRRHHQELYRYCRALLPCPEDAQDALQATMAAALRALPGECREIALRPWLYRVAHNEAISIARRRREEREADDPAASVPGADVAAADRERLRAMVADLNALPERQRGALVMRELSDLSYAEIGAVLATSESAARQTVYEAREAMRESKAARETDCAEIREVISARDGRVLRGRRVRAHLRGCEGCSDFLAGISARRADLRLLAPPLPAVAATGILAGIAGEAGKTGVAASIAGATGGASMVAKGGALVAAAVVGAGAAGVVDLPGAGADRASAPPPAAQPADAAERADGRAAAARESGAAAGHAHDRSAQAGQGERGSGTRGADGAGNAGGRGESHGSGSHGQGTPAGGSDGVTGPPAQANGIGPPPSAGTGTGNAGGHSAASNGVAAAPPQSDTAAERSNAGAGEPPEHASGPSDPDG